MLRALPVAAVLLTACSFGADYGGTGYQCGSGERCPAGQTCVDGYCASGDPIDAGGSDEVCGSLSLLRDELDDSQPGPEFESWADPGVTVDESGGQLRITVAPGAGDPYGGYQALHQYDLTEGVFEARVAALGGTNTVVEVANHLQETAQLVWEDDQIAARVFGTADPGQRAQIAYDPTWVFWRIRVSAGVMSWEVSADRTDWIEVHAEAAPFDVTHVRGLLSAGGQGAIASTARFESVNTEAPTSPGFCAGETLTDDFAAAPLSPLWFPYDNGDCNVDETGGALTMTYTGVGSIFCGIVARHLYDLTASEVVIDSSGLPIRGNFVSYFQVVSPDNGETRFELSNDSGTLYAVNRVNGVENPIVSTTYDPTDHRFWRLRGAATQVEAATAPAAAGPWTVQLTATPGFSLDRIEINVGAGHYATVTPAGAVTATVPGVNAP
jgi:hypothetical protein